MPTPTEVEMALAARGDAIAWAMDYEILTGRQPTDDEIAMAGIVALDRRLGYVLIEGEALEVPVALEP